MARTLFIPQSTITSISIACMLALVIIVLFSRLKSQPSKKDRKLHEIKRRLMPIDPTTVSSVEFYEADSSYTENKKDIYLCLRDAATGRYYDINTLTYVSLHELAHVKTHTLHHSDEFKNNFHMLLQQAEQLGLYNSKAPLAPVYCGVVMR